MTKLNNFFSISSLLLTAAIGVTLGACDPKMIGAETEGDVECKDGETKPSGDGCNDCTCMNGDWTCTEKACDEPQACEEGAQKPAGDGCNTCTCFEGQWGCTEIACDVDACQPGETMQLDCNTCECVDGGWSCTDKGCGETSTSGTETGDVETTGTDTGDVETTTTTGMDTEGVCGNGLVEAGEACDDGNQIDDDACANDCGIGGVACLPNDPFQIGGATIEGDTLKVAVTYGGGCEEHVFDLCWNEIFAESFPVQTWIALSHEGNDDFCDALLMEVKEIDLSGMKAAYQASYQTQNGTIMIHLDGHGQLLDYTF